MQVGLNRSFCPKILIQSHAGCILTTRQKNPFLLFSIFHSLEALAMEEADSSSSSSFFHLLRPGPVRAPSALEAAAHVGPRSAGTPDLSVAGSSGSGLNLVLGLGLHPTEVLVDEQGTRVSAIAAGSGRMVGEDDDEGVEGGEWNGGIGLEGATRDFMDAVSQDGAVSAVQGVDMLGDAVAVEVCSSNDNGLAQRAHSASECRSEKAVSVNWNPVSQDGVARGQSGLDTGITDGSTAEMWGQNGEEGRSEVCNDRLCERQGDSVVGMLVGNSDGWTDGNQREGSGDSKHLFLEDDRRWGSSSGRREDSVVGMIMEESDGGPEICGGHAQGQQDAHELSEQGEVQKGSYNKSNDQEEVQEASFKSNEQEAPKEQMTISEEKSSFGVSGKKRRREESTEEVEQKAGEDESAPNAIDGGDEKPLSKSAQKKLRKLEWYAKKKENMRAREKEKKHQQKEQRMQEWNALSEREREEISQRNKETRKARKEQAEQKKERMRNALGTGQKLVIDLEFCEHMRPNEIISLGQQVMYSYAASSKAAVPACLCLTGLTGDIKFQMEKFPGFGNWFLKREEKSYIDAFEEMKSDLVYLTADSDNILESLDDNKIYIIGGLVDHNRLKGITLKKAKEQGISTARLPIDEHLKVASKVLTVNQVIEILLAFMEHRDWPKALSQAVPQRKLTAERNGCVAETNEVPVDINAEAADINAEAVEADKLVVGST